MVLVSVLLPSYNHEMYIAETIESILNQSFTNFELLIIDDNSSDNSRGIIKDYKEKDDRITIIFHNRNIGIAKTQNELIKMAKGKFIAFLNSDDVWKEDKLEKQLKILDKDENLIVWSDGEVINEKSKKIGKSFTHFYDASQKKKSGKLFVELLNNNYILFSSLILKKENLGDLKFYEKLERVSDYKFMVDLAKNYNFYFIKNHLVKYRIHPKNTLTSNIKVLIKDSFIIRKYFLKKYGNQIPRKIKWYLISRIIILNFNHGKKENARPYLLDSFINYPFNLLNFWYISKSFSKKNKKIKIISRWNQRIYDFLELYYFNKIKK